MGDPRDNSIFLFLLLLVAASVILAGLGMWLSRSGRLTGRIAGLLWALLTIAPLFGAGFLMMTKHTVDMATGKTQSGVNEGVTR